MSVSNSKSLKPCVFFDRDGVVNESPGPGYVLRWEDFHFNPGFIEAFKTVKVNGFLADLITSQKCVGKGLMSLSELNRIHKNMQDFIEKETGVPNPASRKTATKHSANARLIAVIYFAVKLFHNSVLPIFLGECAYKRPRYNA